MRIQPWTSSGSSCSFLEPKTPTVNGRFTIAWISLAFLVFMGSLAGVDAVNLAECGKTLKDAQQDAWNETNSTSSPPTLHLTYEQCVVACGGGIGDINWETFSQSFGAWFLPWIALMFQIPFGAECKRHIHIPSPFGMFTMHS